MKLMDKRIDYRNGRYYIKDTNIRVDLVVGLGVEQILENYPWLNEKQVLSALDFAKELITKRGKGETAQRQIQTA